MIHERLHLSPPHMSGRERDLVQAVFDSNWIAPTGPMVDAFETGLAALTGTRAVAALASGTAALHLALRLCDVQPGDAVWGATMTFIGGVAPIRYLGAEPVFLDVSPDDLLLDLDMLESALATGAAPKVVISTDLYGNVVDMRRMRALADRHGFRWISDSAEAAGAERDGRHAGSGADFIILSFNGNKIITSSGGGALASDDVEAIDRARFLSTQARAPAPHYEHETCGYNYRLSNVCAAIGVGQLDVLRERVDARRAIHARYVERLGAVPGLRFHAEAAGTRANRWLTTIVIDPARAGFDREAARRMLEDHAIESRPLWKPMHMQPVFAGARTIGGAVAEAAFADGLCLPSGSAMRPDQVDRVADLLLGLVR
jgi:pyridoxal phosphate-dependent aminotransferase EpsN